MMSLDHSRKSWRRIAAEIAARVADRCPGTTTGSTHVRTRANTDTVLLLFILASTPALLVRAWGAGQQQLLQRMPEMADGWRLQLLQVSGLSMSTDDWLSGMVLGLLYILPLLLVAGVVSLFWAAFFARARRRSVDPGWMMVSWLFVLLLPADLSPLLAAIGMSFGAVIGQHVFGGTGRYIASPAALGALFVQFSYPGAGALSSAAGWTVVAAANTGANDAVWPLVAVGGPAAISIPLALASLAGAALLARAGAVSLRSLVGGVAGVLLAGKLASLIGGTPMSQLSWHWHLLLGSFPVCLAFIVTDPTTLPLTRAGRWMHGALFGLLVVAIRVLDPTHPEGSLFAVLLAALIVPLIDYIIVKCHAARVEGGLKLRA